MTNAPDLDAKRRELEKLKEEQADIAADLDILQDRWRAISKLVKGLEDYIASFEPKPRKVKYEDLFHPVVLETDSSGDRPALRPTVIEILKQSGKKALDAGTIWERAHRLGCQTKQKYPASAVHFVMQDLVKKRLAKRVSPGKWRWVAAAGSKT